MIDLEKLIKSGATVARLGKSVIRRFHHRSVSEEFQFSVLESLEIGASVPLGSLVAAPGRPDLKWLARFDVDTVVTTGQEIIRQGWAIGPSLSAGIMAAQSLSAAGRSRLADLRVMKQNPAIVPAQ